VRDGVREIEELDLDVREGGVHALQPGEGAPRAPRRDRIQREPRGDDHQRERGEDHEEAARTVAHGVLLPT
jgi:hypothetical protein